MQEQNKIVEKLNQVPYWFQYFEVAPGVFTPGKNDVAYICDQLGLPQDLTGMSVLDVGAYDGGFSFECERRGASSVLAYDLPEPTQTGFAVAKEILGSKVEYRRGTVYKLTPEDVGTFDIVLFAGVLYHLRYPLLACDRLRSVTRQCCYVETHIIDNCVVVPSGDLLPLELVMLPEYTSLPISQFYEAGELNNDTSNWFGPNIASVVAWFRSAGFETKYLSSWGSRAAFKAEVTPDKPGYYDSSYEGFVIGNANLSVI